MDNLGSELHKLIIKNNGYNYQIFLENIIVKIHLIKFDFMVTSRHMIKIYFGKTIINYIISSASIELFISDLLNYVT
jgi:hypothetical protein